MTTEPSSPAEAPGTEAPRPDSVADSVQQGPGRLIRLARERARISLADLAGLTKLAPATLEALERDDFGVLSEPVYVRGYYRKCAKALAVSEQELLAAYDRMVGPRTPQAVTKLLLGSSETGSSLKKTRRRSGSSWVVWLLAIIALVAVAAWFLRDDAAGHHSVSSIMPAAPADAPAPRQDGDAAATSEPAAAIQSGAQSADGSRPLSTNELSTTPSDRGVAPAAAPVQPSLATQLASPPPPPPATASQSATAPPADAAPAGPDALHLAFKSPSWVRVEDSAGKLLLSGVIQAGDHQTVSGKPPYSLFIGNAPGVTLEFQGQPVDMTPFVKSNNTARLSVPVSGG